MEGDDLDNLIADSIGGVQSALEAERKAAPVQASGNDSANGDWAKEAARDLHSGPRADADGPNEEFFANLVKTFQDPQFQKAMSGALQADPSDPGASPPVQDSAIGSSTGKAGSGGASSSSAAGVGGNAEPGTQEFMQNFLQSFDKAVGSDPNFEQSLTHLMSSMLSNDLLSDPIQQIVDKMEPWLKKQKGLPASEMKRYEDQLHTYKSILGVYRSRPEPLPEDAREEVQRLIAQLQLLGNPPDEVMQEVTPKDAQPDNGESFEDFMKTMGLGDGLGSNEQDLLKKLSEDPEELTKVMKDMAEGFPEEACKQQ